ncbi:MAG: carbon-nitrogen hydrolase family protein, partial [Acinetobacter sp.]
MSKFAIAGVQMAVSAFEENITRMEQYAEHIKQRFPWVNMLVFSELCALGPSPLKAQPMPGNAEQRLQEIARKTGLWLIPGSLFEQREDGVYNTAPVINPQGE